MLGQKHNNFQLKNESGSFTKNGSCVPGKNIMNGKINFFAVISICLINFACAGPNLSVESADNSRERESSCNLPVDPSNMLALLLSYKPTMRYLTNAEDACRFAFADMLKREVKSSFLMSDGCAKITLEDIEDALHRPEILNERLNYFPES